MRSKSDGVLLQTLCYSDIFDYPLSKEEIRKFLISDKKISSQEFEKALAVQSPEIYKKNKWYCLAENKKNIEKRKIRQKESEKKITHAKKVLHAFSFFPTIKFIGISGSLALFNAKEKDDIDIFVITAKNTLWLTRLFLVAGLFFTRKYRARNDRNVANKICLNMMIDEASLTLPKNRQNLYTAHEVVQVLPLFNKDNMFEKFLAANSWAADFLPNSSMYYVSRSMYKEEKNSILNTFYILLNTAAKAVQLWFIKRHQTTETVNNTLLAFHPDDYTDHILLEYKKRLRRYGLVQ